MFNESLRQLLENLLKGELPSVALGFEMDALARRSPQEFNELASVWAKALLERDPQYFSAFLRQHLNNVQADVIEQLLPQLEGDPQLFSMLYRNVATSERWNKDILVLARSSQPDEAVLNALNLRQIYYNANRLDEQTALTLYKRNAKLFKQFIANHLSYAPDQYNGLLKAAEHERHSDETFYWKVFSCTATKAMWEAELRDLLKRDIPAVKIKDELAKRQYSNRIQVEVDPELWRAMLAKYGDAVKSIVLAHSNWYLSVRIQEALDAGWDNERLNQELSIIASGQWYEFRRLASLWAMPLYERDADYFEDFILRHMDRQWGELIPKLMARAEADGRDRFFRVLYQIGATEQSWNQDLLALTQSEPSDTLLYAAIKRRDGSTTRRFALNPQCALALYQRNPDVFREFVQGRVRGKSQNAAQLHEAMRGYGDENLYWSLFREWADNDSWQAELRDLLAQDIPAEQIAAELEKRHPNHMQSINPAMLREFYVKYGEAVKPYLEKHISMVSRKRLQSLLALDIDRTALLRELENMARSHPADFRQLADVWAAALYEREPYFFESFLIRNLDQPNIIYALLPRIEAAGQDNLFKALYRKIVREEVWNRDLLELARSPEPDEKVHQAIERRDAGRWFTIDPDVAVVLYQRNADLFRETIKQHLRRFMLWGGRDGNYAKLSKAAQARGDDDLYWFMFRVMAQAPESETEIAKLLAQDIPADEIAQEIEKRTSQQMWQLTRPSLWVSLLSKYGAAVWPQIKPLISRLPKNIDAELVAVAKHSGDTQLYWDVFWQAGAQGDWNKALKELADQRISDTALAFDLHRLSPPDDGQQRFGWRQWYLDPSTALKLYQRAPLVARPFIERYLDSSDSELFREATQRGDEEMLDYLSFRYMRQVGSLIYRAYPRRAYWGWNQPDKQAQEQIKQFCDLVLARLERLAADSITNYVRHAANIFARFRPFEVWSITDELEHNRILAYLVQNHHEAWRQSPEAIRELLESPNIFVQIIALDMLSEGSANSAQRVVENLMMLRALLLGRARRNTKKKVLACLENALKQAPEFAAQILPVLEETMDFRGERTISERLMVSYVRARRQFAAQMPQPPQLAAESML